MAHEAPAPTGKLAYQAYATSLSQEDDWPVPLPDWSDLKPCQRRAWRYVAAVLQLDAQQEDPPDPEALHA